MNGTILKLVIILDVRIRKNKITAGSENSNSEKDMSGKDEN